MAWHSLSSEAEIKRILDFSIRGGTNVEVHIPGEEETYFSRFVKLLPTAQTGDCEGGGDGFQIVLRDLSPRDGNDLVRTAAPEVEIFFPFSRFLCRFRSNLVSGFSPQERLLARFPGLMEVEEKRKEERLFPGSPDFLSAVFTLAGEDRCFKTYDLKVLNYSNHGLGLLVGGEDRSLLACLEPGVRIAELFLFGEALLARISAFVRHTSEIQEGPYTGFSVVGLESEEGLDEHLDPLRQSPY